MEASVALCKTQGTSEVKLLNIFFANTEVIKNNCITKNILNVYHHLAAATSQGGGAAFPAILPAMKTAPTLPFSGELIVRSLVST